jgi:L-aspartate oxidase
VAQAAPSDVLVIGSGAAGLSAAVSAERAGACVVVATKTTLQANNSSKAQGGIQAALGDDDTPGLHADDVMRSSHETADPGLVEILTSEAPSAIAWLEELGCRFTRENGGYRLARCGGASRKRLLQVGDRTGHAITKALREGFEAGSGAVLAHHRLTGLEPAENGWRAMFATPDGTDEVDAAAVVLASGGRCFAEAATRPVRRRGSPSMRARARATSTRSSTTRTAAPGRPRCRATPFRRRRARTARCF